MNTYQEAEDYLYGLRNRGSKLGIERMRSLVDFLDRPDRSYPVIHVAGTNGKGSTCAMLEAIFRESGYRTGLFTSPHLVHLGERIQCDRLPLEESELLDYVTELRGSALEATVGSDAEHVTFFEFMTVMAFYHFQKKAVDVAIIETGLGGRLDSTNVVEPEVSVITSIALDHTQQLGDSLAAVAGEKAGIIKKGKPVVFGFLPSEAERVIRERAGEQGSRCYSVRERFGEDFDNYPSSSLVGEHQRINAGMAQLVCEVLGDRFSLDESKVVQGLSQVRWAGRWQELLFLDQKRLILDAAHNAEGARALDGNLARFCKETETRPVVAVGILGLERAQEIMPVVLRWASAVLLLEPGQPRSCSFEELEALVPAGVKVPVLRTTVDELESDFRAFSADALVVTGSIYLLGEILADRKSKSRERRLGFQDLI